MTSEFPDDELLAAYREGTRTSGPSRLGQDIRDRLARPTVVMPKVALTCLASAAGLASFATLLLTLTTRDFSGQNRPSDPPPMFQKMPGDLFHQSSEPTRPRP